MHLVVMFASTLFTLPLVVELATAMDRRAMGGEAPPDNALAAGAATATLLYTGGLVVLARRGAAVVLFLLAAVIGLAFGRYGDWDELSSYGFVSMGLVGGSLVSKPLRDSLPDRG